MAEFFRAVNAERPGSEIPRRLQWLSTHPLSSARIAEVERLAGPADPDARPWLEPDAWRSIVSRVVPGRGR